MDPKWVEYARRVERGWTTMLEARATLDDRGDGV
jgi:hypothetical protein